MELSLYHLERRYEEFLDDTYPSVEVAGYRYSTSEVLKSIDRVAYDCGFNDWLDNEIREKQVFEHKDGSYHDEEEEDLDAEFYEAYESTYEQPEPSSYAGILFQAFKP